MSIRLDVAERFARLATGWKARARLRQELEMTSDRALAELQLSRGDVADVVSGTYRRAA